jgi:hypothetical protein
VLLIIAIVLLVLFAGAGFFVHVLWLGLIIAAVVAGVHVLGGGTRRI